MHLKEWKTRKFRQLICATNVRKEAGGAEVEDFFKMRIIYIKAIWA